MKDRQDNDYSALTDALGESGTAELVDLLFEIRDLLRRGNHADQTWNLARDFVVSRMVVLLDPHAPLDAAREDDRAEGLTPEQEQVLAQYVTALKGVRRGGECN